MKGSFEPGRLWPLALGVLLGVAAGVIASLLVAGTRRAEAAVLISSPAGTGAVRPQLPNLRELATSGVVVGNLRSTLRLSQSTQEIRDHLHAVVRPKSEVIALSADDANADHARQIAQEAAVVFAQVIESRFGAAKPELHAALLDSAHIIGAPARHFLRNGLAGALAGLLLGSSVAFVLAGRRRELAPTGAALPADDRNLRKRESALETRVKLVTERERRLAARAGELAAREKQLDLRAEKLGAGERDLGIRAGEMSSAQRELAARVGEVAASERALESRAAEAPPPPAVPSEPAAAAAAPSPGAERLTGRRASFNLADLERLVAAQAKATPEQLEEWRAYLFYLREHAAPDGSLPSNFEGLIAEVFADAGL